ncbi:MAG: hypothetical protein ACR2IQ_02565 [Minisyncoccia bacterium]
MEQYQKTPLVGPTNGYNDGQISVENANASQGITEPGYVSAKKDTYSVDGQHESSGIMGIKKENSMEGYLQSNNPAY